MNGASPLPQLPDRESAPSPEAVPPPALVELSGAGVTIGRTTILDPLSLAVGPGEFIGILGPNGAGKSTLLGLINATMRPSRGRMMVLGRDPWALSGRRRARLRGRIATVHQRGEYNSLVPLTARDVVGIGLLGERGLTGRWSAADADRVDEALARMGIEPLAGRPYRHLSGGEQQKVQLARALVQRPELLLLDEPATGLDLEWQERLIRLVADLSRRAGLTIIMTTHLLHHLPDRCRRVVLLREGRLLCDGSARESLTAQRLEDLYGCPVEVIRRGGRHHCLAAPGGSG